MNEPEIESREDWDTDTRVITLRVPNSWSMKSSEPELDIVLLIMRAYLRSIRR